MSEIIHDFDLIRCPFCGGKAIMESWEMLPYERLHIESTEGKWYSVFCNDCQSSGSDCTTAFDAAKTWNSRVEGETMRCFDHNTTWEDVQDMTAEEAISILSEHANSDGRDWTARPHIAKACQMAIEALKSELGGLYE